MPARKRTSRTSGFRRSRGRTRPSTGRLRPRRLPPTLLRDTLRRRDHHPRAGARRFGPDARAGPLRSCRYAGSRLAPGRRKSLTRQGQKGRKRSTTKRAEKEPFWSGRADQPLLSRAMGWSATLSICTVFPVYICRAVFPNLMALERWIVARHKDDAQVGFSPFSLRDSGLRRATCRSAYPRARMLDLRC
jgi:hypothetical protein